MSGAGPVTTIREAVTQRHYVTAVSFYEGPPRFVCTVVNQLGSSTENARRQIYGSLGIKRGHPKNQKGPVGYGRDGKGPAPRRRYWPNCPWWVDKVVYALAYMQGKEAAN